MAVRHSPSRRFRYALTAAAASIAAVLGLGSCTLSTPFAGEGYSRKRGVTLPDAGESVVVAVTHALLDGSNRRDFDAHSRLVVASLPQHQGYIGHSVRTSIFGNEVWTMTVWRDQHSLDEFMRSPVHTEAIKRGLSAVLRGQFERFDWPREQVPPSWQDVDQHLASIPFIDYAAKRAQRPLP